MAPRKKPAAKKPAAAKKRAPAKKPAAKKATPRRRPTPPPPPPLVVAVTAELVELGVDLEAVDALLALQLAADLSAPMDNGRPAMTKELRSVMAQLRSSNTGTDAWDEAIAQLSTPST